MVADIGDTCSLATVNDFKISHLDWYVDVDFKSQTLKCEAKQKYERVRENSDNTISLDSKDLQIESITVNGQKVEYELLKAVRNLGQPLRISLPDDCSNVGCSFELSIKYTTSPSATATQWMSPAQTLGRQYPYVYTQCEAIHARSLLPCIDSPSCKFTYAAEVVVEQPMVALMSAVKGETFDSTEGRRRFTFEQKIPIPSYLLALAVGNLESRTVGPRSKVWCESAMIEQCEFEFADVEKMLCAAESLMGPYVWGRYDLLILPPSFPLGGMENPCLTFVTPSIIAGDRSLTNVVVHEITHSWTGNLVTNKTWEHFWLNEGFTRFLEDKIIGLLHGEPMRQFMGIHGWESLIDDVQVFGPTNKLTALTPVLDGVDPDDTFSSIPYEKGSSFLYYIESLVGGPAVFNPFLRDYIDHFKFQTIVTEDFKSYLYRYFKDKTDALAQIDWDAWLHGPGMPPVNVIDMYDKTLSNGCKQLCERWANALPHEINTSFKEEDFTSFNTMQKIDFLTKLYQETSLSLEYLKTMSNIYKLPSYKVSEIEFAFLRLCVRAKWVEMYDTVVDFVTKLGRMKFVRPMYREMFKYEESKKLAVDTFRKYRHVYHNLAARMLLVDLKLDD